MTSSRKSLQILFDELVKVKKNPCFEVSSNQIEIITAPVDYYLALHKLISMSERRISMSSLYLGLSNKEEFLLEKLNRKLK